MRPEDCNRSHAFPCLVPQPAYLDSTPRRALTRARNLSVADLTSDLGHCGRRCGERTRWTALPELQNSPARKTENMDLPGFDPAPFPQKCDQEPEQKADAEGGNYRQKDLGSVGKRLVEERMHVLKLIQHARS